MKKAIVYARVSTPKQKQTGNSLNDQVRKCKQYCKIHNMDVVEIFEDDFTGTTIKRPGLKELFQYLSGRNDIDYCVIKHIDRGSRGGVEVYENIKNQLSKLGVQLRDTYGVIQDRKKVISNISGYTPEYDFCYSQPSRISETVTAISSQEERDQILRRTIPREIELERQGYHVRNAVFGYKNEKVKTNSGKKTVQVKDPIIGNLVIELFKEKGKSLLSDKDIVDNINTKGLRTRSGKKITVKYFQTIIKKPIYAGVIISKWSGYTPIKTAYSGLISIDLWNKANKGKRSLIESENGDIQYLEGINTENQNNISKRRKKFNPNLPFRNLIESSEIPGKMISGSFSNPKRSKSTGYYHPIRGTGQKGENIKKEYFESQIIGIFEEIQINDVIKIIFEDRFNLIFEENKEKIQILKKIESYKSSGYGDPENFKKFCFYVIEHLSELLIQSKSHEELSTLFKFVFKETPTYDEINNRTFQIYPIFALQSKKEPSIIESSSVNRKWQGNLRKNGTLSLFMRSIPYSFIKGILKSGIINQERIDAFPKHITALYSL